MKLKLSLEIILPGRKIYPFFPFFLHETLPPPLHLTKVLKSIVLLYSNEAS
nr:MAG TPA_asm: hypothetical protein [Caudoviricetes sp.]